MYKRQVIAVDAHSNEMVNGLNESGKLPVKVVYKGTAHSSKEVEAVFKAANNDEKCIGIITWMHTFSPAKMWIHGLQQLKKPLLHLHTQMCIRDRPRTFPQYSYRSLRKPYSRRQIHFRRERDVYKRQEWELRLNHKKRATGTMAPNDSFFFSSYL